MRNLRFPSDPLGVLQSIFGLHPTSQSSHPLDVIIIALDLEMRRYTSEHIKFDQSQLKIREVGVSMLDTRDLCTKNPKCHLITKQFIVGTHKETERAARIFHFGTSERVDPYAADLKEYVMGILQIVDEQNRKDNKFRKVVLAGHGFSTDLSALRRAGITLGDFLNVVGILDTTFMAKEMLGCGFKLGSLLDILGINNSHLHNAGNDANFCLEALLMLSYHAFRPNLVSANLIRRLRHLKESALQPLPDTAKQLTILRALSKRTENEVDEEFLDALDAGMFLFDDF